MFSFVIPLTDLKENPEMAIKSLLNHKKYVKETKLVCSTYTGESHYFYKDWPEDKEKLNIEVISTLDLKYFNDQSSIIVELPPFVELKLGDFDNLIKQSKESSMSHNQYGLGTYFTSNNFNLLYGVLMIMIVMEWFINRLWYRNKFINSSDIRCRFVIRKGDISYIGKDYSYYWNIFNTEVKKKEYGDATISLNNTVLEWLFYTNRLFNFGFWILMYFPFYIFLSLSFSSVILYSWSPWIFLGAGSGLWLTEMCISFLICRHYLRVSYLIVYCILFPFYWVAFPYIFLYFKFSIK